MPLGKVDVIHAFPTSGKTGLVMSSFKGGDDVPYIIDTDALLFGVVMPNEIHHQLSDAGNAPWKQAGNSKDRIWWRIPEAMAMMMALAIADNVDGIVITNLVGTKPYWDSSLIGVTFAPSEDDAWQRHVARHKAGGKERLTAESVVRSWHQSYAKHTSDWAQAVTLSEGEFLCDYFGLKFNPEAMAQESEYYAWIKQEASLLFPNWDMSAWAKRVPAKASGQQKDSENSSSDERGSK